MPTEEASAAATPTPDVSRSPLRWTLLGAFAILLALLVVSGVTAVHVLREMHRQAQSIRAASAEREQANSNICVSVQIYDQTITRYAASPRAEPDQDVIDGLSELSAQVSGAWNRYPEERPFLETLRDLVAEQRALYAARQPALVIKQEPVLHARVLECAKQVSLWSGRGAQQDDLALLAQFGELQSGLSRALLIAFGSGLVLAAASMVYIVRLERQTRGRYYELARSRHELQLLSSRLVDAQETERRSISRELHDEVGQSLGALLVDLGRLPAIAPDAKEQIDRMKSVAERTFQSVRNISLLLRPSMLDDLGLAAALEWQGREVSRNSEIEVDVQTGNLSENLPDEYKICIYRFVQEALHNAVRHSAARTATVTAEQSPDRIVVQVKDDGRGFDPRRTRGLGLLGMEERVKRLGGTFTVHSAPQQGATVIAELPWPPKTLESDRDRPRERV
ncbi:MAG: sensor histidine kinase [Bryobacteraceae bacterium]|jgi:signal transduction histidine kinase